MLIKKYSPVTLQECSNPPTNVASGSGVVTRQQVAEGNTTMIGVLKEVNPEYLTLEFLDSNIVWDEGDFFVQQYQRIRVLRLAGDEQFKVGDTLSFSITEKIYDPTRWYQFTNCGWSAKYFAATEVSIYPGKVAAKYHVSNEGVLIALFVILVVLIGGIVIMKRGIRRFYSTFFKTKH